MLSLDNFFPNADMPSYPLDKYGVCRSLGGAQAACCSLSRYSPSVLGRAADGVHSAGVLFFRGSEATGYPFLVRG